MIAPSKSIESPIDCTELDTTVCRIYASENNPSALEAIKGELRLPDGTFRPIGEQLKKMNPELFAKLFAQEEKNERREYEWNAKFIDDLAEALQLLKDHPKFNEISEEVKKIGEKGTKFSSDQNALYLLDQEYRAILPLLGENAKESKLIKVISTRLSDFVDEGLASEEKERGVKRSAEELAPAQRSDGEDEIERPKKRLRVAVDGADKPGSCRTMLGTFNEDVEAQGALECCSVGTKPSLFNGFLTFLKFPNKADSQPIQQRIGAQEEEKREVTARQIAGLKRDVEAKIREARETTSRRITDLRVNVQVQERQARSEMQEEIARIQRQIGTLRSETVERERERRGEMQRQISTCRGQIDELWKQNDQRERAGRVEMQRQIAELRSQIDRLTRDTEAQERAGRVEMQSQTNELRKQMDRLTRDTEVQERAGRVEMERQIAELQRRIGGLTRDIEVQERTVRVEMQRQIDRVTREAEVQERVERVEMQRQIAELEKKT